MLRIIPKNYRSKTTVTSSFRLKELIIEIIGSFVFFSPSNEKLLLLFIPLIVILLLTAVSIGTTPQNFIVRRDLRDGQVFNPKWILFENKGNFSFEDTAEKEKIADYEFSWGAVFEDLNLDGRDDLIVSENYIQFPPHKLKFLRLPGRVLLQTIRR